MKRFLIVCSLSLLCFPLGCRLAKASPQLAFMGDSITYGWRYPSANFGIMGQTTGQMLQRLPSMLSHRSYQEVVILGGTNDVLQGVPPNVPIGNIAAMATEVQGSGARPVLCEIPPIFHSYVKSDRKSYSQAVKRLNSGIATLAASHKWELVDYYDPMRGHPGYMGDGVHPKRRGYAVMEFAFLRSDRCFGFGAILKRSKCVP